MYGFNFLCEISQDPFDISCKIWNPYTAKYAVHPNFLSQKSSNFSRKTTQGTPIPDNETEQRLRKRYRTILRKKRPDRTRKTNIAARCRRYWWVHSIIAHHSRTTNRPPPTQNNHEPKRQNKPQRTTRWTTSRPWLFHRHAYTWTKIPDKKWTMDARGER